MWECWGWLSYIFSLPTRLEINCSVLYRPSLQFHVSEYSMRFSHASSPSCEWEILRSPAFTCWNWRVGPLWFTLGREHALLQEAHLGFWQLASWPVESGFSLWAMKSHVQTPPLCSCPNPILQGRGQGRVDLESPRSAWCTQLSEVFLQEWTHDLFLCFNTTLALGILVRLGRKATCV